MTGILMQDLSPQQRQRVGREIVKFRHRLEETGLFSDHALARLIDETPRDQLTICTMQDYPRPDDLWLAGEAAGLCGGQIMQAVREGKLWISPRSAMTRNPRYARVFRRLMDEFSEAAGVRVLSADAAVLISSPRMGIFFHVDPAETMLWHVRGHKTVHVYPPKPHIVGDRALEAILLKETLSDLPWSRDMDAEAVNANLAPGDALYWPLHSPHYVTNDEDLNVSVSVEFSTLRSRMLNGVFYTHGVLRRRLGLALKSRGAPLALLPLYMLAAGALKAVVPPGTVERDHRRVFDVDLSAPDCIRWRDGVAPQMHRAA